MEIIGYFAAILIGISLGLIGGGGSILTVPVLVYLMHIDVLTATAYSLFIVGITALAGGIQKFREGYVNMKAGIIFGIPSIVAVFLTRMYLIPILPEILFTIGNFVVTKSIFILVLFALLMVVASISMIYQGSFKEQSSEQNIRFNYPLIMLEGSVVGVLTGMVGAGGGFLIIPALVLFTKLPMKTAIGTSLLIIASKSLIGFLGDVVNMDIDWELLNYFSVLAIIGIFIGNKWSHAIDNSKLKKVFGWFVLVMGIYIILKETIFAA